MAPSSKYSYAAGEKKSGVLNSFLKMRCHRSTALNTTLSYVMHGEFYCLDKRGMLRVLDPDNLTWRVLFKSEPIHSELSPPEYESCQLVKLHGDLIAVFREDDTSAIRIFKLNWCRMSWTKLDDLGDFVLFVGHQHSIAASSLPRSCNISIYFPRFDGRDHRMGVHYSMEDQKYHPRFYDLQELTISVWLQPNI